MSKGTRSGIALAAVVCAALACIALPRLLQREDSLPETAVFRMEPANRGAERYSAWFGDSDGRLLYFGLSAFWEAQWSSGDDPAADLAEPGDHLIGRFDLASESFLEPLRVRALGAQSRSSVWDVLVHSSGRIYYTTYFEEIGSVDPAGRDPRVFEGIGAGYNELVEGPNGRIYVTRYSSTPFGPAPDSYGAVVVLSADGELLDEFRFEREAGGFTAPKSVAVDPGTGEIWINTDTFRVDGAISHETIRLDPDGRVLSRTSGEPELHFVRFDAQQRGWFAEVQDGQFRVRVVEGEREFGPLELGPRLAFDFIQDIHFAPDQTAVLSRWSGRVHLVRIRDGALEQAEVRFEPPSGCGLGDRAPLLYSAVAYGDGIYGTVYCGGTVLRAPLPPAFRPVRPRPRRDGDAS